MGSTAKPGILFRGARAYVKTVDRISEIVGKGAMFLVLLMMAILLMETFSRLFFNSAQIWAVEFAQFVMAAYYILGGAYVLIIGGHVRMDLVFHRWSPKNQALSDVLTFAVALIYIVVLWYGGWKGLLYAIKYKQVSYSSWAPSMIPIKIILQLGLTLMFFQMVAEFIKNLGKLFGREIV